jgi:hypothetical protein
MAHFIPGVQLNEMFYREAVAPIIADAVPGLAYSAALIGYGSDVTTNGRPRQVQSSCQGSPLSQPS